MTSAGLVEAVNLAQIFPYRHRTGDALYFIGLKLRRSQQSTTPVEYFADS
jgi:hypothetical protein